MRPAAGSSGDLRPRAELPGGHCPCRRSASENSRAETKRHRLPGVAARQGFVFNFNVSIQLCLKKKIIYLAVPGLICDMRDLVP